MPALTRREGGTGLKHGQRVVLCAVAPEGWALQIEQVDVELKGQPLAAKKPLNASCRLPTSTLARRPGGVWRVPGRRPVLVSMLLNGGCGYENGTGLLAFFWRSSIGFDRVLGLLDEVTRLDASDTYPPYNIEKTGGDAYRITLAVAGFTPDELSITSEADLLTVSGKKAHSQDRQYLHQGIAARAFERQFTLADYVKVLGAKLEQGLLTIDLVREVPEVMKPRRIEIANSGKARAIENKRAA